MGHDRSDFSGSDEMGRVGSGQIVVGQIVFDRSKTGRIMERQEEETAVGMSLVPFREHNMCLCCPEKTWESTDTYKQPLFPIY